MDRVRAAGPVRVSGAVAGQYVAGRRCAAEPSVAARSGRLPGRAARAVVGAAKGTGAGRPPGLPLASLEARGQRGHRLSPVSLQYAPTSLEMRRYGV